MQNRDRNRLNNYRTTTGRGIKLRNRGLKQGFNRRFVFRNFLDIESLTNEEKKKILHEELKNIEREKNEIEKRLIEIETGIICQDQDAAGE